MFFGIISKKVFFLYRICEIATTDRVASIHVHVKDSYLKRKDLPEQESSKDQDGMQQHLDLCLSSLGPRLQMPSQGPLSCQLESGHKKTDKCQKITAFPQMIFFCIKEAKLNNWILKLTPNSELGIPCWARNTCTCLRANHCQVNSHKNTHIAGVSSSG